MALPRALASMVYVGSFAADILSAGRNLSLPTADDLRAAAALLTLLFGSGWLTNAVSKWYQRRRQKRALEKLAAGDFLPVNIKSALRHYVEHEVSAIDPAGRERDRANLGPREPLFRLLDRTLYQSEERQHLLLLADSGMGKTTALLNYYAHNTNRKNAHPMVAFSLRSEGVDEKITAVSDKAATVLLLDALDEDPKAIADHTARVQRIMRLAQEFRAVVISCRSQFFLSSEEIIKETGLVRIHHRKLTESAEYVFMKFYLCPFSDPQVNAFLRKRYPFPRWGARRRARAALARVRDLTARPMLLAYIDDLTRSGRPITNIADAYDEIVKQWISRERPLVKNSSALLAFSKKLAVDLYLHRESRGGEHVSVAEIVGLAADWRISLKTWQLTGRSLLTRDAADHFRFAHRSILEYLFVRAFIDGESTCASVKWTDQMYTFLVSIVGSNGWFNRNLDRAAEVLLSTSSSSPVDDDLALFLGKLAWEDLLHTLVRGLMKERHRRTEADAFVAYLGELLSQRRVESLLELSFAEPSSVAPRVNILAMIRRPNNSTSVRRIFESSSNNPQYLSLSESTAIEIFTSSNTWGKAGPTSYLAGSKNRCTFIIPTFLGDIPFGILTSIYYEQRNTSLQSPTALDIFHSGGPTVSDVADLLRFGY